MTLFLELFSKYVFLSMVLRVEGFLSCDSVKSDNFAILDQTVEHVLSQRHRSRFVAVFYPPR